MGTKEKVIKTVDVPSDLYFDNTIPKHVIFGGDVDASKIVPVPSVENGYIEVNNQKITQAKYDNTVLKDAEETVITGELTIEHPSFFNDQSTLVSVNVDSLEISKMHVKTGMFYRQLTSYNGLLSIFQYCVIILSLGNFLVIYFYIAILNTWHWHYF